MTKRISIRMAVAAAFAAAVAFAATPTSAATAEPPPVRVTANPDGLLAPGVGALRPGLTTFTVATPDTSTRYVGVVGLEPGAAPDTYLDNMTIVLFSEDEEANRRAGEQVDRDLALAGGVAVQARAAQSITVLLRPGTYYLVDYTSLGRPEPTGHWHQVNVSGNWSTAHPAADHVVLQYERTVGQPRFLAPVRLAPRTSILIVNTTDVLHEAVFVPVLPGATDADIDRCFAGQGPCPILSDRGAQGMLPIVGGQRVVLHADLAPGRYVLISWVGEDPFAGMHRVIDVVPN